jgi:hypothetical protein
LFKGDVPGKADEDGPNLAVTGTAEVDIFSGNDIEENLINRTDVTIHARPAGDSKGPFRFEIISDGEKVRISVA